MKTLIFNKISIIINNNPFIYGLLFIIILHTSYFILGTDSYVTIHDNLDSEVIYLQLLKSNNILFERDGIIPNVFDGLSTTFIPSEYSFIRLIFLAFPAFWAYILNSIIVRYIGFLGLFLFAKDYVGRKLKLEIIWLIAISFSAHFIYPMYGLTIMGQPLLFWAVCNLIFNKKIKISILIILLYPFYSHVAFIFPFILFAVTLIFWLERKNTKTHIQRYFATCTLLVVCIFIANNSLFLMQFTSDIVTQRVERKQLVESINFNLSELINLFLLGHYHIGKFLTLPFLLPFTIGLSRSQLKIVFIAISLVFLIYLLHEYYDYISFLLSGITNIFNTFQLRRFTLFTPIILYSTLIYAINYTSLRPRKIYTILALNLIFALLTNTELRRNYELLLSVREHISFRQFYAEDIFQNIKKKIEKPQDSYKVVSVGLHPSISQYNGFHTYDSYQNIYPLKYKKNIELVIADEIKKSKALSNYFLNWGSRCYIFSSELYDNCNMECFKDSNFKIENLNINTTKLLELGVHYIFSSVEIVNSKKLNITHLGNFENNSSLWKVHVYKIEN